MTIQEILAAADELTPAEQVQLLRVMIERYSPPSRSDDDFLAELQRRSQEMKDDPEASIDGDEAMARVRESIGRRT